MLELVPGRVLGLEPEPEPGPGPGLVQRQLELEQQHEKTRQKTKTVAQDSLEEGQRFQVLDWE